MCFVWMHHDKEETFISRNLLINFFSFSSSLELEKSSADAVLIKRARHVIGETERTLRAAKALKDCDFHAVSPSHTRSNF